MDKHFRAIILKIQNRLSDDDRFRLHFFLGDDVPRIIRDDLSLRGTLKIMDSLIDQDKINEQDFTFLINAFDEIQCTDAAKLLREYLQQIQSNQLHLSIQSLASIMPPILNELVDDQEEDKYVHIESDNTDNNSTLILANNQNTLPEQSAKSHTLIIPFRFRAFFLLFVLLLIIGVGILIFVIIQNSSLKSNQTLKINSQTTIFPHIVCSAIPNVTNFPPENNYQVEHLNLTCSQPLSYLNITYIVQRSFNEIHAKQYQTLWKDSTNITYKETSTQIIYNWYALPGMHIGNESFSHFVEAQFYYTNGRRTRITRNDIWQVSLQSIRGDLQYLNGTF